MATVGIFFGSDTGNTENIAKMIQKILQKQFGDDVSEVHDIAKSSKEDLEGFDILLLGIPTWYYGEAQCDWDDFFPTLEEVDFNGKLVALFGCGDQEDYAEYFCDAMGTIRDIIEPRARGHRRPLADQRLPLRGLQRPGGRQPLHRSGDRRRPSA